MKMGGVKEKYSNMQGGSSLNFCSFRGGAINFKNLEKKKFPPPSINNDRSLRDQKDLSLESSAS
jgi:hypothetical protein